MIQNLLACFRVCMYTKTKMNTNKWNVKKALQKNRRVDTRKLAEVLKIVKELGASGITGESEYNLISPFSTHKPGHNSQQATEDRMAHGKGCR